MESGQIPLCQAELGFAVSDPVTIVTLVLAAIPTTIASVLAAVMTMRSAILAKKTHNIVNGSMLIQLKLHAKTARALANIKNDPEAVAIAVLAEKMLDEHKDKLINLETGID